ncbi:glycerophosphodiester phosphodiesterase family protein [Sphingobacterium hungaricum]
MRRFAYILICISTLLSCVACFQAESKVEYAENQLVFNFKSIDDLYQFLTYDENRYPLVSAHRGGAFEKHPENALETFAFHAKKRPTIIECDVQLTKDSVLVLMHDELLERTTTGQGRISSFTYDEIAKLNLKDTRGDVTRFRVPTLQSALKWGKGKVIYTLDVKKNVPYSLVVDAIRNAQAESNVIIITYSAGQAGQVHSLAPDLMISANIKNTEDFSRLASYNIPDNRIVAFVGTKEADESLVERLHAHGIMTILGTIGNLDRQATKNGYQVYAEYIDRGADILSTDHPQEAQKALDYYIKKRKLSSPFLP